MIKSPGDHPDYFFEAEPHFLLGIADPPGPGHGSGFGLGFRGTIEIVDNGFISSINNTVGIGFGLDWVSYSKGGKCENLVATPAGLRCDGDPRASYLWLPITLQWNFFVHERWSVFGEPGVAFRLQGPNDDKFDPFVVGGGARYHFSEDISLTLRVGYPTFSVGLSIFL